MATLAVTEAQQKFSIYSEFKESYNKLDDADKTVVKCYLDKLLRDWSDAIHYEQLKNKNTGKT